MPAHNADRFIAEAIESVLAQTWRNFILIIVDDGSTDGTLAMMGRYAAQDTRIRIYTQPNAGTAPTLNRGIALAEGEWVFLMHADDRMRTNRIERQVAFIAEHPELAVASSLVRHIDGENRVIGKDNSKLTTHDAVNTLVSANQLIGFNHPAVALRKSAVLAVGGYRQAFWPAEDLDLWNRVAEKGYKILVQPEFLLDYRIHGNSASVSKSRLTLQKCHWLRDCMLRRRAGQTELDWESFLTAQRALPWLMRTNMVRIDLSKACYKSAVSHYATKAYLPSLFKALFAVLLRPAVTLRQIYSKMVIPGTASNV
jgi:glycosyltransferase involved in cell wall biosynthesis